MTPHDLALRIAADPAGVGFFLDFDGVLAPIVEDPSTSAMTEGLHPVLERIAGHVAVLAIISGRPATFLADRAPVAGARLLGVYGTQEWRDDRPVARPEIAEWEPALDDARNAIAMGLIGHRGVLFEDKALAVAVHWRQAPDRETAGRYVQQLLDEVADETGLDIEPGKLVAELRPPIAWDKGSTVNLLLEQHDVVLPIYAGDDLGDVAAFRAVRAAEGIAIAVDHGEETPDAVRDEADLTLDGPAGVGAWLHAVDRALPD